LVRIEDLDRERCRADLAVEFLRVLEGFGFEWDGTVDFQSHRIDIYEAALAGLRDVGRCYPCRCSRALLAASLAEAGAEPVYPGTCRDDPAAGESEHALRYRIADAEPPVRFEDLLQGSVSEDCRRDAGDFVIRRRDGYFAYHLAVVVDDALQGISEVVRGSDLLSSTPRQILLQRSLGYRTPAYAHLPLLKEPDGRKLAKSRRSAPLDPARAAGQLWNVLNWLRQDPPAPLAYAGVAEIWDWAIANWRPAKIAGQREVRLP
jgi:glutamyl-Q tRNA(Asp) synthetase